MLEKSQLIDRELMPLLVNVGSSLSFSLFALRGDIMSEPAASLSISICFTLDWTLEFVSVEPGGCESDGLAAVVGFLWRS